MTNHDAFTVDTIVRQAHSFRDLLNSAETADPVLAKALLGNATNYSTTRGGSIVVGAVSFISGHYGFGWDNDTVLLVSGGVALVADFVLHWWQLLSYRKTLPPVVDPMPQPQIGTPTVQPVSPPVQVSVVGGPVVINAEPSVPAAVLVKPTLTEPIPVAQTDIFSRPLT